MRPACEDAEAKLGHATLSEHSVSQLIIRLHSPFVISPSSLLPLQPSIPPPPSLPLPVQVDCPHASPLKLSGGSSDEVMGVAWCRTLDKLAMTTCSSHVRLWRVQREKRPRDPLDIIGTCTDTSIDNTVTRHSSSPDVTMGTPIEAGYVIRRSPAIRPR